MQALVLLAAARGKHERMRGCRDEAGAGDGDPGEDGKNQGEEGNRAGEVNAARGACLQPRSHAEAGEAAHDADAGRRPNLARMIRLRRIYFSKHVFPCFGL